MTSYTSFRAHGCCQRNHPLRTKHGACPRISFRTAYLSECPQTCPSARRNHLAPFRNLQLLLRRHSASGTRATTADRWCSTLGKCALRRAFLPVHLASSSATGRSTGLCTSGCRRPPYSTCSLSPDTILGCETFCGDGCGTRCRSQGPCPQTAICAAEGHRTFVVHGAQPRVHQRSQAQVSRLDQGGSGQDKRLGCSAHCWSRSCQHLDGISTVALQRMTSRQKHHFRLSLSRTLQFHRKTSRSV